MRAAGGRGVTIAIKALALLTTATSLNAQVARPPELVHPTAQDRALLKDAIDIHMHLDPDSFGPHSGQASRSIDTIDMARRAKNAGMRGFVIKQHFDQTAALAYLTAKEVPGVEVFGQLCMNLTIGGLNPAAVYHFAEVKGGLARIVAMPTWDSENNVRHSGASGKPFVAVSRDGKLLPETKAVIAAVAAAKVRDSGASLALSTGHVSPSEALMIIKEAKAQGIKRIVVTHAMGRPVNMSILQMKEAAALGALVEFIGNFIVGSRAEHTVQQYVDAIRAVGPDNIILSSDGGQATRSPPDDLMAYVAGRMLQLGIAPEDLRKMMVENPARLLGLTQP